MQSVDRIAVGPVPLDHSMANVEHPRLLLPTVMSMRSMKGYRACIARLPAPVIPQARVLVARSALLVGAFLICAMTVARAAEGSAVLAFAVPPIGNALGAAKPTCGDEVDVTKVLADPSRYRALLGVDADATVELDTSAVLLHQLAKYGRQTKGLAVHHEERVARCLSGCVVLPEGAHVREVLLSSRHAGAGVSVSGFDLRADLDKSSPSPGSGSETDLVDMGDYGYKGLRVARGDRAVCVTAMNWSATETSAQVVRILFDR